VDEVRLDADFARNLVDLCAEVALAFAKGAADVDVEFFAYLCSDTLGFDDVALRAVFGGFEVEDAAVLAGDGAAAAALGVEVVEVMRGDAGLAVAKSRFAAAGARGVVEGAGSAVEFAGFAVEGDGTGSGALQARAARDFAVFVFLDAGAGKGFQRLGLVGLLDELLFDAAV